MIVIPIPNNTLNSPAALILLVGINTGLLIWVALRQLNDRERIIKLETMLTNEFIHRFNLLKKYTGLEWNDKLDESYLSEHERDSETS